MTTAILFNPISYFLYCLFHFISLQSLAKLKLRLALVVIIPTTHPPNLESKIEAKIGTLKYTND